MAERDQQEHEHALTRHEEEVAGVETPWRGVGHVRARKRVVTERVREDVPRAIERVELRREPAPPEDSGEITTLPDGSISIPVYEEELVVTKRKVLRERVIVRKHTVTERQRVRAELRKERVSVDADDGVLLTDERALEQPRRAPVALNPRVETRPFFLTSEFLAALAIAAALLVAGATDALDAATMWLLLTVLVGSYVVARGFAKARTPHGPWFNDGGDNG